MLQGGKFCSMLQRAASENFNQVQLCRSSLSRSMLPSDCQAFTRVPAFAAQHATAIVSPWETSSLQPARATESLHIWGTSLPPTGRNRFPPGSP